MKTVHAERPLRGPHKEARADLRKQYELTLELGLVTALTVIIALFHVPLRPSTEFSYTMPEQERVQMEELPQTNQLDVPPPPPRPRVPVAVADDVVLEDETLDFDATLDLDEPASQLPLPPPPEPPRQEKADQERPEPEIFVVVEEMPELVGGIASIQQCIDYPSIAQKAGIQGRVFVQFVVDEAGRPMSPSIMRGIGGGCDEEAIRCVMKATFKPGRQRGKPVRVRFVIPVHFILANS